MGATDWFRKAIIIYNGTEVGMTHDLTLGNAPYSDLQAKQLMLWRRQDRALLAFYQQLIRQRKQDDWSSRGVYSRMTGLRCRYLSSYP